MPWDQDQGLRQGQRDGARARVGLGLAARARDVRAPASTPSRAASIVTAEQSKRTLIMKRVPLSSYRYLSGPAAAR